MFRDSPEPLNHSNDFDFGRFIDRFKTRNKKYPNIIDMTRFEEFTKDKSTMSSEDR